MTTDLTGIAPPHRRAQKREDLLVRKIWISSLEIDVPDERSLRRLAPVATDEDAYKDSEAPRGYGECEELGNGIERFRGERVDRAHRDAAVESSSRCRFEGKRRAQLLL